MGYNFRIEIGPHPFFFLVEIMEITHHHKQAGPAQAGLFLARVGGK